MKFIHISDLHIGKRLKEHSLFDDQKYILGEILSVTEKERPDAVLIAGDIYDKSVPTAEAVTVFDDFLFELSKSGTKVFIISGNHDSAERLSFASRLMKDAGVYISRSFNGAPDSVTLTDEYGECNVYMLPFVKPASVRRFYPEREIESYTDAVDACLCGIDKNGEGRRVLITHQFVTGASRTESEELSVGGADNVDIEVFEGFDYVALGHIHRAQSAGAENIRYSGTPLKYSFSECRDEKSVTVVELREKGNVEIRTVPLKPLCDMFELRGSYGELMSKSFYDGKDFRGAYLRITLTDEEDIPDAMAKMRVVYPGILTLRYDNTRTSKTEETEELDGARVKSPAELFADFYEMRSGKPMSEYQRGIIDKMTEEIWEV